MEMIKGPASIVLLKNIFKLERAREFGKFQHLKYLQWDEQRLHQELFNLCFYNILEIHKKLLFMENFSVNCDFLCMTYMFVTDLRTLKRAQNQLSTTSTYHTEELLKQLKWLMS